MLQRAQKKKAVAARLESYHRGYHLGLRSGTQRAKANVSQPKRKVRKSRIGKKSRKDGVIARLGVYQEGYHRGIRSGVMDERARQEQMLDASEKVRKAKSSKRSMALRKATVAARLDIYQKAYQRGLSSGLLRERTKQEQIQEAQKKGWKAKSGKRTMTFRRAAAAARLDIHRKAYRRGLSSGLRRARIQQEQILDAQKKAWKARSNKRSKSFSKCLAAARLDAYMRGVQSERTRQEHTKPGRVTKNGCNSKDVSLVRRSRTAKATPSRTASATSTLEQASSAVLKHVEEASEFTSLQHRRLREKTSLETSQDGPKAGSTSMPAASIPTQAGSTPLRGAAGPLASCVQVKAAMRSSSKGVGNSSRVLPAFLFGSPTPARAVLGAERSAVSKTAASRKIKRAAPQVDHEQSHELPSPMLARAPSGITLNAATDDLRSFLADDVAFTREPAAFQLRCQQHRQADVGNPFPKKVVVIVGGKCRLWKLNQIISECFDASEQEFVYESKSGVTALGSHFKVSRPLPPAQGSNVIISSSCSASHIDSGSVFVRDHDYSVAQLFRGKSTRYALERDAADASQQVIFSSPLLRSDVAVSLDGIMLDSYDSHNLFDRNRRHSNGQRPLPRIVRSSFLSVAGIEAKNIALQGSREGPNFLSQFDTSWSAIHAHCRRSQRQPLFCKDGRDFDLDELCHANQDEETDSDGENNSGDSQ